MINRIVIGIVALSLFSFATPLQRIRTSDAGKDIFSKNCTRCHGMDGTKGKWGAKNLQQSTLSDVDMVRIITQGRGIMPSWKNSLTNEEIESVKDYVKTLRHTP